MRSFFSGVVVAVAVVFLKVSIIFCPGRKDMLLELNRNMNCIKRSVIKLARGPFYILVTKTVTTFY